MAKVVISEPLVKEIKKRFSTSESNIVLDNLESLEKTPHKGKALASEGNFVIKELKYKKFRFYFITDGFVLKFGTEEELADLLIRFVRMSKKKDQKKIIENIRNVLKSMGMDSL